MRTPVIAANWKMYKTPAEAESFVTAFLPLVEKQSKAEIVLCPATPDLTFVLKAVAGSAVHVGAQNMHFAEEGAYTGEISAAMLTALGCRWVILGHSERRQYFAETEQTVAQKIDAALRRRLKPIVCIGERLKEREVAAKPKRYWQRSSPEGLSGLTPEQIPRIVIAYEPVWAIGTGKTATPEMAADAHRLLRGGGSRCTSRRPVAEGWRILYGGSVKPDNVKGL